MSVNDVCFFHSSTSIERVRVIMEVRGIFLQHATFSDRGRMPLLQMALPNVNG